MCGVEGSPRVPVGLVSMRLCSCRTSRVYRVVLVFGVCGSACLVSLCVVLPRQDERVLSIGGTSSLSQRLRCGPFLCLLSLCVTCSPLRPCTAHPPSHVYTAIGLGGALWGRMQEDRHGAGRGRSRGALTWFLGVKLKRVSTSGEGGAGGCSHVGSKGWRPMRARWSRSRQGCRAATVAIVASCSRGRAACAVMCVCARAYAMHLADTYPHVHSAGVR